MSTPKFKIGDYVEIINGDKQSNSHGCIGKITDISIDDPYGIFYKVEWLKINNNIDRAYEHNWWFLEYRFKKITGDELLVHLI